LYIWKANESNRKLAHKLDNQWDKAIAGVRQKLTALQLREAELTGILQHFTEMKKAGEPWPGEDAMRPSQ